jgi:hypothetical protein
VHASETSCTCDAICVSGCDREAKKEESPFTLMQRGDVAKVAPRGAPSRAKPPPAKRFSNCFYLWLSTPVVRPGCSHHSRYDRPSHRVFMTSFYRAGWQVRFPQDAAGRPSSPSKPRRRSGSWHTSGKPGETSMLEHEIETGRGGWATALDAWQHRALRRPLFCASVGLRILSGYSNGFCATDSRTESGSQRPAGPSCI